MNNIRKTRVRKESRMNPTIWAWKYVSNIAENPSRTKEMPAI